MVSDNGSCYIHAYNNQVIGTGGIGIAISSGHDNAFYGNRIVSTGRLPDGSAMPYSNVGAYIWNYNGEPTFADNVAYDNLIDWVSWKGRAPFRNDMWFPDAEASLDDNASVYPPDDTVLAGAYAAEWTTWQAKLESENTLVGPETDVFA